MHAATSRDKNIDEIEDELIKKLKESVPFMLRPREILAAFHVINAAKRRGAHATGGDVTLTQNIVSINLPAAARERFITNYNGEVVQVGNRTTVTMPLQTLLKERIGTAKRTIGSGGTGATDGKPSEAELLASLGAGIAATG